MGTEEPLRDALSFTQNFEVGNPLEPAKAQTLGFPAAPKKTARQETESTDVIKNQGKTRFCCPSASGLNLTLCP
jgi:hypothetical protein